MKIFDHFNNNIKSLLEYREYWYNYRGELAIFMTQADLTKEKQLKIIEEIHRITYLLDEIDTIIDKTFNILFYGEENIIESKL